MNRIVAYLTDIRKFSLTEKLKLPSQKDFESGNVPRTDGLVFTYLKKTRLLIKRL